MARHAFTVTDDDAGERLDKLLAARVPELSRRQARVLIDIGGVFVDGARVKVASRTLRSGQNVVANVGGALARATKEVGREARARDDAELPPLAIVHRDRDIIVVDKPAGLLTAPTPESDRNNLAAMLGDVFVVHRIDLQTSGLLVFARNGRANYTLSEVFRRHAIHREYAAVVAGTFEGEARTIERPVRKKRAVTHVAVEQRLPAATVLGCRIETGRTHQIRIHCAEVGHPVLGDPAYGRRTDNDPPRMALHARALGFDHPRTGEPMRFDSPLPPDLTGWLESMRKSQP